MIRPDELVQAINRLLPDESADTISMVLAGIGPIVRESATDIILPGLGVITPAGFQPTRALADRVNRRYLVMPVVTLHAGNEPEPVSMDEPAPSDETAAATEPMPEPTTSDEPTSEQMAESNATPEPAPESVDEPSAETMEPTADVESMDSVSAAESASEMIGSADEAESAAEIVWTPVESDSESLTEMPTETLTDTSPESAETLVELDSESPAETDAAVETPADAAPESVEPMMDEPAESLTETMAESPSDAAVSSVDESTSDAAVMSADESASDEAMPISDADVAEEPFELASSMGAMHATDASSSVLSQESTTGDTLDTGMPDISVPERLTPRSEPPPPARPVGALTQPIGHDPDLDRRRAAAAAAEKQQSSTGWLLPLLLALAVIAAAVWWFALGGNRAAMPTTPQPVAVATPAPQPMAADSLMMPDSSATDDSLMATTPIPQPVAAPINLGRFDLNTYSGRRAAVAAVAAQYPELAAPPGNATDGWFLRTQAQPAARNARDGVAEMNGAFGRAADVQKNPSGANFWVRVGRFTDEARATAAAVPLDLILGKKKSGAIVTPLDPTSADLSADEVVRPKPRPAATAAPVAP